jgi:hypothetical protein
MKFTARSINQITKDELVNFAGLPQLFKISGRVAGNAGVVEVSLRGPRNASTKTVSGRYSFDDLPAGGPYTITPASPALRFKARTVGKLFQDELINFDPVQDDPTFTPECSKQEQLGEQKYIAEHGPQLFVSSIAGDVARKMKVLGIVAAKPSIRLIRVEPSIDRTCRTANVTVLYDWSIDVPGLVRKDVSEKKAFVCHRAGKTWTCP